jgi:hypothetical protein
MQQEAVEGYRLSPQQKRIWTMRARDLVFDPQCVMRVEGFLKIETLVDVLQQIVERHEILRTSFSRLPGIKFPVQAIGEFVPLACRFVDWRGCDAQQQAAEASRLRDEELRVRDEQQQAVRFALCALSEREYLLVVTLSALCADTMTMANLVGEIRR